MLTKATQILFDPKEYKKLASLANMEGTSVGDLVRKAVRITYFIKDKELERKWLPTSSFGAWKDHSMTESELMNILVGEGLKFYEM